MRGTLRAATDNRSGLQLLPRGQVRPQTDAPALRRGAQGAASGSGLSLRAPGSRSWSFPALRCRTGGACGCRASAVEIRAPPPAVACSARRTRACRSPRHSACAAPRARGITTVRSRTSRPTRGFRKGRGGAGLAASAGLPRQGESVPAAFAGFRMRQGCARSGAFFPSAHLLPRLSAFFHRRQDRPSGMTYRPCG